MHLSAVRIRGFKSFRDPIELRFEPGVSVIVGPNGSGKSNIADALSWAMATQASGMLRASGRDEILFAGSERHSASGVCEVELVLDNADGGLPSTRAEVSIMRRVAREGDGDYLLNRTAVRRMDVRDLLADAGLGRELHCIVAQGSVDQVLLARPDERRGLVEEAAGLGKFKRRRQRAQQKLGRVRSDLERAADIEREVRARLRPLELQATAAERAEMIAGQLAESRLRLLGSQLAEARALRHRTATALTGARAEHSRTDGLLHETAARRAGAEQELAQLALEQERASARAWAIRSAVERLQQRSEALAQRDLELAAESARDSELARTLQHDAERIAGQATTAAGEAELLTAELAALDPSDELALERADAELQIATDASLSARRAQAELRGSAGHARSLVERLAQQRASSEARLLSLAEAELAAAERLSATSLELAAMAPTVEAARAGLEAAHDEAAETRTRLEAARESSRGARAHAATAGETAAALQARVEALDGAIRRADSVAPGTRELAARGAVLALALVEPDAGLELAVAATLERRGAQVVAADMAAALTLLEGGIEGASVLLGSHRRVAAKAAPAGTSSLAERVRLLPGAPSALLDGTWLVDSPAQFAKITHGLAITPGGFGFDADAGVVFCTGSEGEAGLLRARRELAECLLEATSSQAAAEQASQHAAAAVAEAAALEGLERELTARATALRAELDGCERRQREQTALHEQAEREVQKLVAARADLAAESSERAQAADRAAAEAGLLEAQAVEAEAAGAAADARRAELDTAHRLLAQAASELRARRAGLSERRDGARREADRLARASADAALRAAAMDRRVAALSALNGAAARLAQLVAACSELGELVQAPFRQTTSQFEAETERLSGALRACALSEAELTRALAEASAQASGHERELTHLDERAQALRERASEIAQKHELAIVAAVEPLPEDESATLAARIDRLERRRAELGAVNPLAKQEFDEVSQRLEDVQAQSSDLQGAIRELERLIRSLSREIGERFEQTFSEVERGFREIVPTLFPGGRGQIVLTKPEPIDADAEPSAEQPEPGIELEIQPAGKRLASMALLSGGERSLGALAFLFALMLARPSPFYVLDEVDAALDEANIARFVELIDRYRDRAQFIVITHQQLTMEIADVLYGVSMAGDGVSTVLSRKLDVAVTA